MMRKVTIKKVKSSESLKQITDTELNELHEEYEPENYEPIGNMEESITIRLTKDEKNKIISYLEKKGFKRSSFIREAILNAVNEDKNNNVDEQELEQAFQTIKSVYIQNKFKKKKYEDNNHKIAK